MMRTTRTDEDKSKGEDEGEDDFNLARFARNSDS